MLYCKAKRLKKQSHATFLKTLLLFSKGFDSMNLANAGVVKLVDTIDSKSIERKLVSVQVRSPVNKSLYYNDLRCTDVRLCCFLDGLTSSDSSQESPR